MVDADNDLRAQVLEAYEAVGSLDRHGELVRLLLVEVSLLAEKYRKVRRHDVPHIAQISGLLDVLWQEIEMDRCSPRGLLDEEPEIRSAIPLTVGPGPIPAGSVEGGPAPHVQDNRQPAH